MRLALTGGGRRCGSTTHTGGQLETLSAHRNGGGHGQTVLLTSMYFQAISGAQVPDRCAGAVEGVRGLNCPRPQSP
jgi:hypothetical protein